MSNASTTASQTDHENTTNIKETIESILVAFILAFIFRAFVVEAFVIPTGSMAPTLLGAHMRFVCRDCGYQFDVNYQAPQTGNKNDDPQIPASGSPLVDVYCPNCGYLVAPIRTEDRTLIPYPVQYGDRILVLKYIYLMHPPQRWDVVVFKSPDKPDDFHYAQNYIKRLVGLPGEHLMVLDGDIYVSSAQDPVWRICTKPQSVQEALWRIVYDNDFYPQHPQRSGQPFIQPWRPVAGSGWDQGNSAANGRAFKFSNAAAAGTLAFDINANSTTQTFSDYLAYDASQAQGSERQPGPTGSPDDAWSNAVSDLKLTTYYHRTAGDGDLRLKLSKHDNVDHTFIAQINRDSVSLLHHTNLGDSQIGKTLRLADLGINPDSPVFIELQNVDYQVTLRLNGKIVLQSTPVDFAPNIDWLTKQYNARKRRQPGDAEIEAEKQTCTLDHISLWRDVYYTNGENGDSNLRWAKPGAPTVLGNGEYFVMGDNSAVSEDARYWEKPILLPNEGLDVQPGRVPEQFLLGKAVFVYWPAGYHVPGTPFSIIPNFGDMRWIH
jgi:signal peptidase I